jgi:DNA-binding MurR/RpiR family transcriptional regulator
MSDAGTTDRARSWLINLAHEHRVSPTQRRVIQYMLAALPGVAFASTIEVAEAAGVSQPTVTRLASALGYPGYPEFRGAIRDMVLSQSTAAEKPTVHDLPATALSSEQQNLAELERMIGSDAMRRAVDLLAATQPLGIIGLRASAALADYLGYFAGRVLPDVHVLKDAASMDDDILQLHLNGASAVVAFVMPRYPDATVRALASARRLGMATVAIVDSPLIPFAGDVDAVLVAPVGTDLVFDSHAGAVVLAIALLDAIAGRDSHRTQERLEAHEELVEHWVYPER